MASPLRILTVVGARPQIIKAAAVSRAFAAAGASRVAETILHTGQHYDDSMSRVFFRELGIPDPRIQLGVGSGKHGAQTARMLEGIEQALDKVKPDLMLVYGDTNSTLAASLVAAKAHVPLAHVEAGLRSFDKSMPEEVNRIVCDHCSTWLFCPTPAAVDNLVKEGFNSDRKDVPNADRPAVLLVGDVMYDNSLYFAGIADRRSTLLKELGLERAGFFLATVHRAHNTDDPIRLKAIMEALVAVHATHGLPVVLPLHPRTKDRLETLDNGAWWRSLKASEALHLVPPVGFLDMVALERGARLVLTDSGGVQKEAFFFGKPVVVLRAETEWVELVEHGRARLADADPERILTAVGALLSAPWGDAPALYGDGHAAERISQVLVG